MSYHRTGASYGKKTIVAVITQDKVIDDNLKRQYKNRTLYIFQYIFPEFFNILAY